MIEPTITALIHNTAKDTWHPVAFRDSPMPGPSPTLRRVKSMGHHTEGFATRDLAITWIQESQFKDAPFDANSVFAWDGENVPAIVSFLDASGTRILL